MPIDPPQNQPSRRKEIRHNLAVVFSIFAIVALTVVSVRAYDHYQVQSRITAATQSAQKKAVQARVQAKQKAAVALEEKRLRDECAKETNYYNQLTLAQRAKVAAPACNLPLAQ